MCTEEMAADWGWVGQGVLMSSSHLLFLLIASRQCEKMTGALLTVLQCMAWYIIDSVTMYGMVHH